LPVKVAPAQKLEVITPAAKVLPGTETKPPELKGAKK
jgi:hypothetical protein